MKITYRYIWFEGSKSKLCSRNFNHQIFSKISYTLSEIFILYRKYDYFMVMKYDCYIW